MVLDKAHVPAASSTPPIFLLAGLGGDAGELTEFRDAISPCGMTLVTAHLPDLDRPGRECQDIGAAAEHVVSHIQTVWPVGPVHLVGYSIGGFIALEAARRLDAKGRELAFVGLLDTSAVYPRGPDQSFVAQLRFAARESWAWALCNGLFVAAMKLGRRELARRAVVLARRAFGTGACSSMHKRLLVSYWFDAVEAFKLAPLSLQVTLFAAEKRRPRLTDPTLGWSNLIESLELLKVEGDHWSMLSAPNVAANADVFKAAFWRSRRSAVGGRATLDPAVAFPDEKRRERA